MAKIKTAWPLVFVLAPLLFVVAAITLIIFSVTVAVVLLIYEFLQPRAEFRRRIRKGAAYSPKILATPTAQ